MSTLRDDVDDIQDAWQRERPDIPAGSIGVITRIWRVGKLLEEDRRRTMRRLGIDVATRDLLSTLRRSGPPYALPPRELAQRCAVSPGAISQRVSRAEADELVRRHKDTTDGRGVIVELTAKGHDLIERSVDELLRHEEDLLSGLSSSERTALSDLLRTLLSDLRQRSAAPLSPPPHH
ncbi:MarR family winged helix-turn-helix transcriptional regulator [Phytoactinopolyspora mesophila]|uniref:MarR family transcriptional regulator n=1 Tax=Phytoactinopolyspora mesophila TaxID=2650750 RepID=A0A7K3M5S4_9ACTN|nr:MarR family transcriptional regulator [Phytoactinopolyspora mesophila]NDL57788.1 MarR family transcriptional regulator [Phytoactinopolyspora mesophila]